MSTSYVSMTDLFCGAGGSSLGATAAGAEIRIALNHWALAVETHNANFPTTYHECTDISACDPRRYPPTTVLWASPECTNHTLAKGQKKYQRNASGQQGLFEGYGLDPASERSRSTMWDVPRFAEVHRYPLIIVENVVEARDWTPYPAWLQAMHLLGYEHREVFFNSQFAWPTPQSRDRLYVVFWRKGQRAPDLDFRPLAWCGRCAANVQAVQSWKRPTRTWGRYERQYVYCCPTCATVVRPYYYCAANAIDWTLPAPRIADRARPLRPKTLARIAIGLRKFAGGGAFTLMTNADLPHRNLHHIGEPLPTQTTQVPPCLVLTLNQGQVQAGIIAGTDPLPTQITSQVLAWLIPFAGPSGDHPARPVSGPWPTQTAHLNVGLLVETNFPYRGEDRTRPASEPWPAQTAQQSQALLTVPFIAQQYGTGTADSAGEPLSTVVAGGNHHALVTPPPFLVDYHRTGSAHGLEEALGTVTTLVRAGLVQPGAVPAVEDCGFRILQPHEVGAAMAFPATYEVRGTGRQRVKQFGNAVTPPVAQLLVERCLASLQ